MKRLLLTSQGLLSIKSRKITMEEFDKCFNFEGANGGITIFRSK